MKQTDLKNEELNLNMNNSLKTINGIYWPVIDSLVNITAIRKYAILVCPADICRAGFTGPWDETPATPTRWLMKQQTVQHGGTHMELQHRNNQSVVFMFLII